MEEKPIKTDILTTQNQSGLDKVDSSDVAIQIYPVLAQQRVRTGIFLSSVPLSQDVSKLLHTPSAPCFGSVRCLLLQNQLATIHMLLQNKNYTDAKDMALRMKELLDSVSS